MVSYYRTMNSKTNASLSVVAIAAVVLLFGSILGHQALAYYYHYHYGHYGHYGHYHYGHYGHYGHYHYHYHYHY